MTYRKAAGAIAGVVLVHAFALVTDLYYFWKPFDIPMHLGGGFVMGLLALALLDETKALRDAKLPAWFRLLFTGAFVSLIAIIWELHECALDQTMHVWLQWGTSQLSNFDTMGDLLNGLIGAAVAWTIFDRKKKS